MLCIKRIQTRITQMFSLPELNKFTSIFARGELEPKERLSSFKDQNVVMFLGYTGAGKSTLINYLLGFAFAYDENGDVLPKNKAITLPAYSNNGVKSITTYPAIYRLPVWSKHLNFYTDFSLCDCPGFGDNRGSEKHVGIAMCLNAVRNKARTIKAMVVVNEYAILQTHRATKFRELLYSLGNIVKNIPKHANSLFFIFNRLTFRATTKTLTAKLTDILEKEENELKALMGRLRDSSNKDSEDDLRVQKNNHKNAIQLLTIMLNNTQNMMLVDICDDGEHRDLLLGNIAKTSRISKKDISFSASENTLHEFKKIALENFARYEKVHNACKLHKQNNFVYVDGIDQYKSIVKAIQTLISNSNEPSLYSDDDKESISKYNEYINNLAAENSARQELLQNYSSKLEGAQRELDTMDTSEKVCYKKLQPTSTTSGFFSDDSNYYYNDIPFTDITVQNCIGKYKVVTYDKYNGLFQATYVRKLSESNYHKPLVEVWVKKREHPTVKEGIKKYNEYIRNVNNEITNENNEIAKNNSVIASIRELIANIEEQAKERYITMKREYKIWLLKLNSLKSACKNTIKEYDQELTKCTRTFSLFKKEETTLLKKLPLMIDFADYIDFSPEDRILIAKINKLSNEVTTGLSREKDSNMELEIMLQRLQLYKLSANEEGEYKIYTQILKQLYDACSRNNVATIRLLVEGLEIDIVNSVKFSNDMSPLMLSCHYASKDVVEILLRSKALVNAVDVNGDTALMYACRNGSVAVICLLLQYNSKINIAMNDGGTALMYACRDGHLGAVKILLSRGASMDIAEKDGSTALFYAKQKKHFEIVELLNKIKLEQQNKKKEKQYSLKIRKSNSRTAILFGKLSQKMSKIRNSKLFKKFSFRKRNK